MRKRRWRKARLEALKSGGVTPVRMERAWCVQASSTAILPTWLKANIIRDIPALPNYFWLAPIFARSLIAFLHSIHVWFDVFKTEYKRCEVCGRAAVGPAGEALKRQMESCPEGRTLPCGPNCAKDQETGVWRKLAEARAA